jgi:hypothetical protein
LTSFPNRPALSAAAAKLVARLLGCMKTLVATSSCKALTAPPSDHVLSPWIAATNIIAQEQLPATVPTDSADWTILVAAAAIVSASDITLEDGLEMLINTVARRQPSAAPAVAFFLVALLQQPNFTGSNLPPFYAIPRCCGRCHRSPSTVLP